MSPAGRHNRYSTIETADFFMGDTKSQFLNPDPGARIGAPDFTLQSLNDDPEIKELHPNTKEPINLSLQLCYRRFLCPKVVNVIVELFAHRHLVRSRVDVS